jgi:hypothetical protein
MLFKNTNLQVLSHVRQYNTRKTTTKERTYNSMGVHKLTCFHYKELYKIHEKIVQDEIQRLYKKLNKNK